MTPAALRAYLDANKLRPEDVAHETGLGINTVYRYLRGERVTRVTLKLITEYVSKVKE